MVAVRRERDAVSFRVHLQPKASHEGVAGAAGGILRLRVTAPPVEGRANLACLRVLAKLLDLPPSRLRIASGHHARLKTIHVASASAETVRARLTAALR
jgi:uncharacterized protein (TIGR00251 family)